jgi:hypothetical protein
MLDIFAEMFISKGGVQSLDFLSGLQRGKSIYRQVPSLSGKSIPLSRFNFSLSQGVSPSNGSVTTSGLFVTEDVLKNSDMENVLIHVKAKGGEISGLESVYFDKLKVVDFKFSPLTAPEGGDRLYTLTFEDIRWRLMKGSIFGYFNRSVKIKEQIIFLANSLKDGKSPWTYRDLIEKCAEAAGVTIEFQSGPFDFSPGPIISCGEEALARLDEFPLNKEYNGVTPSSVLSELLQEIDFTLTCSPGGEVYACPLAGTIQLGPTYNEPVSSSAGAKYKPVPDNVYLIGNRVHDQIIIMPDVNKFEQAVIDRMNGIRDDFEIEAFGGQTRLVDPQANIEGSKTDYGLEPVCPDITGRIRNFYELIEVWGVSVGTASMPYQHGYGESVWRNLFSQGIEIDTTDLERDAQETKEKLDYYKRCVEEDPSSGLSGGKMREWSALYEEALSKIREAQQEFQDAQQEVAKEYLYPEEEEFLESHPDYDVLASKVRIAQQYFFKLYRIPDTVKVKYNWTTETEKEIKEKYVPDAPEGEQNVPRSYVLPFVPFLEEDVIHEIEEDEEEDANKKGKSKNDKKKEGTKIEFRRVEQPTEIRIRLWSYAFNRIAGGVHEFLFQDIKERTLECADFDPELGLVLIHKAPYMINTYSGFSEDAPFIAFTGPVGAEISYERKDPRLGPLNFYLKKLEKPISVLSSPPDRENKLDHFERINEFIDYLKDGEKQPHSTELDSVADNFAGEIWEKAAGTEASQARSSVAAPIYAYPIGPLQTVSWNSAPFTTMFEVNTDYQARIGTTLKSKIAKDLQSAGLSRKISGRDYAIAQEFSERLNYFAMRRSERFQDDERRILINTPHFGSIVMYDPKEEEDVIAISASLFKPDVHYHSKFWLGPLLCRPPVQSGFYRLKTPILAAGHHWFTPNDDLCLLGTHSHKIGGFYYPYVYYQADTPPPPLIKNYVKGEKGFFPKDVRLVNEGAADSYFKAEEFTDRGAGSGLGDVELLQGHIKEIPRTTLGEEPFEQTSQNMVLGLLVEYCVKDIIASDTSAQWYVAFQLVNKDEAFDSGAAAPPRTGVGYYILPITAGEAYKKHRYLLSYIAPSTGVVQEYDNISILFSRAHDGVLPGDSYRGSVFVLNAELVWGWLESAPFPSVV